MGNGILRMLGGAVALSALMMTGYAAAGEQPDAGMNGMSGMTGMTGMSAMPGHAAPAGGRSATQLPIRAHVFRPVKTTEEARRAVDSWLWASGLEGIAVGKVSDVSGIYVVNLVDDKTPRKVRNQVVIRKADGYMMMVFPSFLGGAPAKSGKTADMVGMDSMGGMSGMVASKGK